MLQLCAFFLSLSRRCSWDGKHEAEAPKTLGGIADLFAPPGSFTMKISEFTTKFFSGGSAANHLPLFLFLLILNTHSALICYIVQGAFKKFSSVAKKMHFFCSDLAETATGCIRFANTSS